jgi:hypothetical protein
MDSVRPSEDGISRRDLENAASALAQASELLSASIRFDSDELMETAYAGFRAAMAKLIGARADYRDQCAQIMHSHRGPHQC